MSVERLYYEVVPQSPVTEIVAEVRRLDREWLEAVNRFQDEVNAKDLWVTGSRITAAQFDGPPPKGWRATKNGFRPDKRTAAGRALHQRILEIPLRPDPPEISRLLTKKFGDEGYTRWADHHVFWSSIQLRGDRVFLSVPIGLKNPPPECRELLNSEVAGLKEATNA